MAPFGLNIEENDSSSSKNSSLINFGTLDHTVDQFLSLLIGITDYYVPFYCNYLFSYHHLIEALFLKLVCTIFRYFTKGKCLKIAKKGFYFTEKAIFILKIFKLYFLPPLFLPMYTPFKLIGETD